MALLVWQHSGETRASKSAMWGDPGLKERRPGGRTRGCRNARYVAPVQAHVVFRHGARSPFQDSPDAPNIWVRQGAFSALPAMLHASRAERAAVTDIRLVRCQAPDLRAKAARLPLKLQLIDYATGEKLPLAHILGSNAPLGLSEKSLGGGLQCGMLTVAGLDQAHELGHRMGEIYVKSGFVHYVTDVQLRCSLTPRTLETLFGCLSGMFPFDCQFPDVHPVIVGKKGVGSGHTDWLNVAIESCPRLKELFMEGVRQWNGDTMPQEVAAFMDSCIANTQLDKVGGDARKYGVIAWRDFTSCRLGSGLKLQGGVTTELYDKIDEMAARQAGSWFMGGLQRPPGRREETLRLSHGRTLAEIVQHLNAARQGERGPKLVLYSAHDWTVMPLMMMLSDPASPPRWPRFCSDLRIEMVRERSGAKNYFVRAFYCSGTQGKGLGWGPSERVHIMGEEGGELVELSKFCELVRVFMPADVDRECACSPEKGTSIGALPASLTADDFAEE